MSEESGRKTRGEDEVKVSDAVAIAILMVASEVLEWCALDTHRIGGRVVFHVVLVVLGGESVGAKE